MLTVKIKTNNAAFSEDSAAECARILREIAGKLENGSSDQTVRDVNGNRVGEFKLTTR